MPSCNTYHLTGVSLTLDMGVSLHGCSSKAQLLLLPLDEGYLLTATLPDLQRVMAPLGPPLALTSKARGSAREEPPHTRGQGSDREQQPHAQG